LPYRQAAKLTRKIIGRRKEGLRDQSILPGVYHRAALQAMRFSDEPRRSLLAKHTCFGTTEYFCSNIHPRNQYTLLRRLQSLFFWPL